MRKILIANDDGITCEGVVKMAQLAKRLGEVTVVAPSRQCSGKSQSITISDRILARRVSFPVPDVKAYSLDGTPTDCVMAGICGLMTEKPDMVFSGINTGYNTGIDVLYSGTIGAAMEALSHQVPAVAFSIGKAYTSFDIVAQYFDELMAYIDSQPIGEGEIWNLNFPDCDPSLVKGVLFDRTPAHVEFYDFSSYRVEGDLDGAPGEQITLFPIGHHPESGPAGTDMGAVLDGYVSVGKVRNAVLG